MMKKLLIIIGFALLILLFSFSNSALSQHTEPVGLQEVVPLASSHDYDLLHNTLSVWADGRADQILEQTMRNTGSSDIHEIRWVYNWPQGTYSNIRAWDDHGPLNFTTSLVGSKLTLTIYFRHALEPGQTYHYYQAITLGNMATNISGDSWNAYWYIRPYTKVTDFLQAMSIPSNATITNITPDPTSTNLNFIEWKYIDTPPGWSGIETHVTYTLSNEINVPLFLQTSEPWGSDPYGRYKKDDTVNTVSKWGCFMTSATMIINYWGSRQYPAFESNPREFNDWLRDNDGYNGGHSVVHASIIDYAQENNVPLYYNNQVTGQNNAILDDYLRSGNPVLMGVNEQVDSVTGRSYAGHFVVATGITEINDNHTYFINDPIHGETTLYEQWDNEYYSILPLSGTPADQRTLQISAHSPVELLVTDELGRKSGYDPETNIYWDEIPEAEYSISTIVSIETIEAELPISKNLMIYIPIDGQYKIEVFGTGEGSYEIDAYASDWQGRVSSRVFLGEAQSGSYENYIISYSSTDGVNSKIFLPIIIR